MPKKSPNPNKSVYLKLREERDLTRAEASELLVYISEDRLEKIENKRSNIQPDEVLTMSEKYKAPELCNYYCANECPLGKKFVPEIKVKAISQIVLEMLASLNSMEEKKNKLVSIFLDGKVSPEEEKDFKDIQEELNKMEMAVDTLNLWVDQMKDNEKS